MGNEVDFDLMIRGYRLSETEFQEFLNKLKILPYVDDLENYINNTGTKRCYTHNLSELLTDHFCKNLSVMMCVRSNQVIIGNRVVLNNVYNDDLDGVIEFDTTSINFHVFVVLERILKTPDLNWKTKINNYLISWR